MQLTLSGSLKDYRKKDNFRFAGLRLQILERDNFECVKCHMTQEQHMERFGKSLTINHIDGQGRNSRNPNNDPTNLETLCLPCHGKADCMNAKWHAHTGFEG